MLKVAQLASFGSKDQITIYHDPIDPNAAVSLFKVGAFRPLRIKGRA